MVGWGAGRHGPVALRREESTILYLLSGSIPEGIQRHAILLEFKDPVSGAFQEKTTRIVMTGIAKRGASPDCVGEIRFPLRRQKPVLSAYGMIITDVGDIGNEFGADGRDHSRLIEPQRWQILFFQVDTLHPFPITGTKIILFFGRAVDKAQEKSPIFLRRPCSMAGGTLQLLHVGGNSVLDDLWIGTVAVTALFC